MLEYVTLKKRVFFYISVCDHYSYVNIVKIKKIIMTQLLKGAICNTDSKRLKWVLQSKFRILERVACPARASPDSKLTWGARLRTLSLHEQVPH